MRALALSALLAAGCTPPDDSGDSRPHDTVETGLDDGPPISAVSWRLHEEIASLAYVTWLQNEPASAWVEYRRADETTWHATPAAERAAGPCEQILLGIPFATDFLFRVVNDRGAGEERGGEHPAETGAPPAALPLAEVSVSDPALYEPTGAYLLTSVNTSTGGWVAGDYWRVIIDREGRAVWAQLTPAHHWTTYQRVSLSGEDLMWDEFTYWANWDQGAGSKVHRAKIDGTIVQTVDTPGGHHAWAELADGSIAWGAANWSAEWLEVRDPAGVQSTLWDCALFHQERGIDRNCQSNTLNWDPASDTFLYSFYTTNTLVQIDRASGATLRVWGSEYGDYAFDPEESAFAWQHGAVFTDTGTLLLSTHTTDRPDEEQRTVAREYEVDDGAMVLRQVWSFGADQELNARTAGEAHRLPNGNTLHNYGSYGRIREVTPDGTIVWDVDWRTGLQDTTDRLIGRSVLIEDLYAFAP